jgi:hypothetical protein
MRDTVSPGDATGKTVLSALRFPALIANSPR